MDGNEQIPQKQGGRQNALDRQLPFIQVENVARSTEKHRMLSWEKEPPLLFPRNTEMERNMSDFEICYYFLLSASESKLTEKEIVRKPMQFQLGWQSSIDHSKLFILNSLLLCLREIVLLPSCLHSFLPSFFTVSYLSTLCLRLNDSAKPYLEMKPYSSFPNDISSGIKWGFSI